MAYHSILMSASRLAGLITMCSLVSLPVAAETRVIATARYDDVLSGRSVSFMATDLATDTDYVLEGSDLECRYAPLSTFKIPNLIIALETGAAASLDDWRPWIPENRPAESHWPEAWRQDQTLKEAFGRSAVWYFRDLALKIGRVD